MSGQPKTKISAQRPYGLRLYRPRLWIAGSLGLALWILCSTRVAAQTFDSGSDGSDGALDLSSATGTLDFFDPTLFGTLDPDGDGVYHFTAIVIGADVTLTMKSPFRGSIVWLATGDVDIDGIIDLSGEDGHPGDESARESVPGAGGYGGGRGDDSPFPARAGNGPGGGDAGISSGSGAGGGAGHASNGGSGAGSTAGGSAYGNVFLLPLLGGSGGGGGFVSDVGGGGGAGGGALLIASSTSLRIDGTISANGGDGGSSPALGGGGGSGGAIRVVAPALQGAGSLSAAAGLGQVSGGPGAPGRIRLESFQTNFTGSANPAAHLSVPSPLFIPAAQIPVRITKVNGIDVPLSPTGSFVLPDVVINAVGAATLDIEAHGIPLGTLAQVTMYTEAGIRTTFDSTPLAGTVATSTATAAVVIPHGLSRFFVEAMWTP